VASNEEVLRKLTIGDPAFCRALLHTEVDDPQHRLDARGVALLRLGALIAQGAALPTWQQCVWQALSAGLSPDEIVGSLMALAPTIGPDRVVAAAPDLAQALGFDVDAALFSWQPKSE
jgi:4-carboxymuconolactone decarboxylase